jgi:hypothetical protein
MRAGACCVVALSAAACADAFAMRMAGPAGHQHHPANTRRTFVHNGAASLAVAAGIAVTGTAPALAGDATADVVTVPRSTTRLGGLLEPYTDTQRGFKLSRPLGWNKFDNVPGEWSVAAVLRALFTCSSRQHQGQARASNFEHVKSVDTYSGHCEPVHCLQAVHSRALRTVALFHELTPGAMPQTISAAAHHCCRHCRRRCSRCATADRR